MSAVSGRGFAVARRDAWAERATRRVLQLNVDAIATEVEQDLDAEGVALPGGEVQRCDTALRCRCAATS